MAQTDDRILDPQTVARVSNLYLVAKTVVEGFITGLHRSVYKGFSVEFSEHRGYAPGDDPRYLDWKVFGRTDRLSIKVFREETNVKSHILLDVSNSMNYASRGPTKFRYGVCLAAALSYLMIRQKDAVGLEVFDTALRTAVKPASSSRHLHRLLDTLGGVAPGGATGLARILNELAPNIKRRSLIILISDLLDTPEEVMRGLSHFVHRRHEVIVFHLLDPAEISLPFTGNCAFTDMETGEKVRADCAYIRPAYRRIFGEFLDACERGCRERGVSYARAETSTPFDQFLHRYLSLRARYT